jgi:ribosomal protein S18 acetylase RimI-like enzyme
VTIETVGEPDLRELLGLLRGYCDFYRVHPPDERLVGLSERLIAEPDEGMQLIARADDGEALGFATVYWVWDTLLAGRVGEMQDLFVKASARGRGVGSALIAACRERAREHGAVGIEWQTEPGNTRAQRLYDAIGAERTEWVAYWLAASGRVS